MITLKIIVQKPLIRFVLGKSQANGFTGFYDGDYFQSGDDVLRLTNGNSGWTLRYTKPDSFSPDYSRPPVDGWIDIDGASALIQKINQAWNDAN